MVLCDAIVSKGLFDLQDYLEIWGFAYTNYEADVFFYGLLQILRCLCDLISHVP